MENIITKSIRMRQCFDSWAANFGEVTTALELTVEGSGFRFKSRFNKFTNLPELMNIFREVADVQTADMLDLDVPALRGGKPIIVESEPDWYVKQVMEDFVVRAERIRGGGVDPSVDNFLKITHEARLLGTDARLIDKDAPNNPDGKLNKVAENVWKEYEKGNADGHIGCQLIFSDIGTPGPDKDFTIWYRWSRQFDKGNNGGSQIDFLRVFCGMSVKEAVFWLLDFAGYRRIENPVKQPLVHQVSQKQAEERKPFVLPEPAGDNSYLISYLNQERGISRAVIDLFLKEGLIYESRHYHNVVFKGNDKNGVTRFASMRGVFDKQGKPFKCDVTGNDKNYGFNVVNVNSTELVVFEAAIDLMSYVDIFADYESNKLALGMLADAPLETFLREHPQITSIRFCLDGDEPGRKAAAELMRKYYELGYEVEDCPPPAGYKDYNEWLVAAKLNLNRMNKRADEPVRA